MKRKERTINSLPDTELFAPGHSACAGCTIALMARHALKAAGKNTIVCNATGCLEVFSTPYPRTAWKVPWIHAAFENAAAVASGVEKALKKQKKDKEVKVLVFGGDGGTFDIGLQALSGAAERGQDICYICYDNQAYMNTGIQRSGATPKFAWTTTSPIGKKVRGKTEFTKNMPFILGAHNAYVATANIAFPHDFIKKVKKGLDFKGPAYIQVFTPCVAGWKYAPETGIELSKLAHNTKAWPLFEIEDGVLRLNQKPSKDIGIEEYLMKQRRFKHLNPKEIKEIQQRVSEEWEKLIKLDEFKVKIF